LTERSEEQRDSADLLFRQGAVLPLQQELERVGNRMVYQVLHRGLPASIGNYGTTLFDADAEWQEFLQRLQSVAAKSLEIHWGPSFRGFRAVQYSAYLLLFVFLLFALGSGAGLQDLFDRPSWHGLLGLVLALLQTLFSPQGFAALGSYFLLQVLLGFRFYKRYKKLLQRHAQKIIESLMLELDRVWEEKRNALIDHLTQKAQQVEERTAALRALRSSDTED
jgi:hypothetical protein